MAMGLATFRRAYLIGAAIIWVAIILATSIILGGTPYFGIMLPIVSAGAFWFVVLIPSILYRMRLPGDHLPE
jgi:hypothetical protein